MQNNKVAIVTGAARRIGAEIAKKLHDAGMNVIVHYHTSQQDAETLCQNLNEKRPHSALALKVDLLKTDCLNDFIHQAMAVWGRLDVLVNNASQFYKSNIGDVSESQWNELIGMNVKAPFFLSQAAAPYLKKHQGCIVNIADIFAERPLKDYAVYSIAKAALAMLTKTLAKELAPDVRVNTVAPSGVLWPEGDNALSDSTKQMLLQRIALQRHGNPDDVAKAVLFLVREATFMTGQVLVVDGGRSLWV